MSTAQTTAPLAPPLKPAVPAAASYAQGNALQLTLATVAFAVCFAVYGSVAGAMPTLSVRLKLTEGKVGLALAVPALLGSLGRIPLGILTDRVGGRLMYIVVLAVSIVPAVLMGWVTEYWQLIACGLLLGIPLGVFAVGVGFVSGWYPPQKQGTALGIFGLGLGGQSLALFGAPLLIRLTGEVRWAFWGFAAAVAAALVAFVLLGRDAPRRGPAKTMSDFTKPLAQPMSWVLSLYYFLTFGGFLAMAGYLPKFLTLTFNLDKTDAGLRAAGFVVLATVMRPIGGWLADKIGGFRILMVVFPTTALFALLLPLNNIFTFTIGALGVATAIGLGNGAVFKLVPQYFPKAVGSVTGLVGAAGGLGGFFPPLVLGTLKQATGSFTGGFLLLSAFAWLCFVVCYLNSRSDRSGLPH